jgi:hypothetical protein
MRLTIHIERKFEKKKQEVESSINSVLNYEIEKKNQCKKRLKKDQCQSELTFHTCDPGHETGITEKKYKTQFLINSMLKDKIKKKINFKKKI